MAKEWSNLAKVVYRRTYARKDSGTLETWEDTVHRAIAGNVTGRNVSDGEVQRLHQLANERKAGFAGRGWWFSGSPAHARIGGTALNNPLHEDTKILTREYGWVRIGDVEGQKVHVLSSTHDYGSHEANVSTGNAAAVVWAEADISSAESQPCKQITFEDRAGNVTKITASTNHRWFRRRTSKMPWGRVTTEELKEGDYAPIVKPGLTFKACPYAQLHGLYFGDGTRANGELHLFGEKAEIGRELAVPPQYVQGSRSDEIVLRQCPLAWSDVPQGGYLDDKRYVYGFLQGYFAADGHVRTGGVPGISSSRRSELLAVAELFWSLGIRCSMPVQVIEAGSPNNFTDSRQALYEISLTAIDLNSGFFLRPSHRERWQGTVGTTRRDWARVVAVDNVTDPQPVLCATVPGYGQFVTEGFILTSNCWFLTADDWQNYVIAQDLLMLGGGVGLSVEHKYVSKLPKVKKDVAVNHTGTKDADFIVPDSREGWCELTRRVLEAFFVTGRSFSYSTVCIRGFGEDIRGFGGVASGPIPLIRFVEKLCSLLAQRAGKHVRTTDAADILTATGEMVVAGNVRRSAIIILGDPFDKNYLRCKRWDLGSIPTHRACANYSVVAEDIEDLHPLFWQTYENGEPFGIVNIKNIRKYGRMGELKPDTAQGVNPCVSGDTLVLTYDGYQPINSLVGRPITAWNGFEWSLVTPRITGYNQPLLSVELSSGQELTCTPYHEFVIATDYHGSTERVTARNLQPGMKLMKHGYPVLFQGDRVEYAYTQGFISGDGMDDYEHFAVYGDKHVCIGRMSLRKVGSKDESQDRTYVYPSFRPMSKDSVPFGWDLDSRLDWFAGLLDSDGTLLKEGGVQISSVDPTFLSNVQLLLTTMGAASKVTLARKEGTRLLPNHRDGKSEYYCQNLYRLLVGAAAVRELVSLGLKTSRLQIQGFAPNRDASRFVTVVDVIDAGQADKVYCFTEPKRNLGCFNGIVTGQCAEATLEDGEPCNLVEQALCNFDNEAEFIESSRLWFRAAKRVTLEKYHHAKCDSVIKRNRRVGVGITGCLSSSLFNASTLDKAYAAIQQEDQVYSRELGVPLSIRTTVVKPSGTMSKVFDCDGYEGIHPAYSRYIIQRVRFAASDPLIPVLRAAGHRMEPVLRFDGSLDQGTLVVDFYVKAPEGFPVADEEWDTWKQLDVLKMAQQHWADQAVSVTVYYQRQDIPALKEWLGNNLQYIKTISFLCHSEHGFKQAPKEKISAFAYEKLSDKIRPISFGDISEGDLESQECAGGVCPVK